MCWIRDCALYWVNTATWRMPELTQFDRTKSMILNLPPKGVAGLHRCWVSALRRSPRPPAMTTANVPLVNRLTYRPVLLRAACRIPLQVYREQCKNPPQARDKPAILGIALHLFAMHATAFARVPIMSALKLCVLSSEILPYAK